MGNADKFERYKFLKNKINFSEHGISYDHVLAFRILLIAYNRDISSIWKSVLNFAKSYDLTKLIQASKSSSTLFTLTILDRKDFVELLETIKKDVPGSLVTDDSIQVKLKIDIKNIITSYFHIHNTVGKYVSFKEKIFLASSLALYRNIANELRSNLDSENVTLKKYIPFCSSFEKEALYAQFFENLGVSTFTLSHGFSYISYRKEIMQDAYNGENLVAQKVFVWGESSKKDLIQNFNVFPDRVIVGGNPKYPNTEFRMRKDFKNCIIIMGRKLYNEGNFEILRTAKQVQALTGINFTVKLHPSLDLALYEQICTELGFTIADNQSTLINVLSSNTYDFAIVNNSTAYYEAMYYGLVCFRYGPDENEAFIGLEDKFNNADQLLEKIKYFKEKNTEELNTEVKSLLEYTLGNGINKYKEILA